MRNVNNCHIWKYIAMELSASESLPIPKLAAQLAAAKVVLEFDISHARNYRDWPPTAAHKSRDLLARIL